MSNAKKIKDLETAIASAATPEAQKDAMRKMVEKLKAAEPAKKTEISFSEYEGQVTRSLEDILDIPTSDAQGMTEVPDNHSLIKTGHEMGYPAKNVASKIAGVDEKKPKNVKKSAKKSGKSQKASKKSQKPVKKAPDYDCDELIEKEKERRKNLKKAQAKSKEAAKKTPYIKNRDTFEKATDRVEADIHRRVGNGEIGKSELEKLLIQAKEYVEYLEKAIRKISSTGQKFGYGGTADSADDSDAPTLGGTMTSSMKHGGRTGTDFGTIKRRISSVAGHKTTASYNDFMDSFGEALIEITPHFGQGIVIKHKGYIVGVFDKSEEKGIMLDVNSKAVPTLGLYREGGKAGKELSVFNYTDNIYASPDTFKTEKAAKIFIKSFRKRFETQGYYRDNRGNKIDPKHIDLEIIPSDFNPFAKREFKLGGKTSEYNREYEKFYKKLMAEHKTPAEFNKKHDAWIKENAPKHGLKYDQGGEVPGLKLTPEEKKNSRDAAFANDNIDKAIEIAQTKVPKSKHELVDSYIRGLFAFGGRARDLKFFNKKQKHEVTYKKKTKKRRKGYKK